MEKFILIGATLGLTVFGQLMIKARALSLSRGQSGAPWRYLFAMMTDPWVIVALCAAVLAAGCWTLAVRQLPVSVAYPFMALSFVLVPLGALVFFGEHLAPLQWAGVALVVAGVALTAAAAG